MMSHISLRVSSFVFILFSFYPLAWIRSIDLSSCLVILFFYASSNLLLSSSNEFLFQLVSLSTQISIGCILKIYIYWYSWFDISSTSLYFLIMFIFSSVNIFIMAVSKCFFWHLITPTDSFCYLLLFQCLGHTLLFLCMPYKFCWKLDILDNVTILNIGLSFWGTLLLFV